ncbi:ArsR family transcriptional regulator [Bacillus sp. FJAT-49736]|uniref:ArsR family transcriptional regulator n=1 Tax=Bacillus sp. FJAT-49736 TaxID=2833582 RepID=UPI001BC97BBE|nr:ArsR family transcriptional regulator [Bacillus sp. FJAT-49736]MBS4172188.1 winged helix-turn-helix transcriptional regulator [Bacillus sp. FJAT-49736]
MTKIRTIASPIYEILLSFSLYKRQTHLKYLGITKNWYKETRYTISEKLHSRIMSLNDLSFEDFSVHLIDKFSNKGAFSDYIQWVSNLSAGELYEMLIPYAKNNHDLPHDLNARKEEYTELLSMWYEEYYKNLEREIDPILKQNVEKLNQHSLQTNPIREICKISRGFQIEEIIREEVLLFPSWHMRPISLIDIFNKRIVITFPCSPDNKYEDIIIKTKALSDETRLRILDYLKDTSKSFPQIVDYMNMTKGNIHHHLLILRSAGLLEISFKKDLDSFIYKYRNEAALELVNDLNNL